MEPRWSPDGRDLYFLDGAVRLVAATVRASASGVDVTDLKLLRHPAGRGGFIFARQPSERTATEPALVEAENWFADVRARTKR